MKKVWICMDADISDLEVDYSIETGTEPVEFWGNVTYTQYTEVDINYVKYKGEFVDDYDREALEQYILDNMEQE